MPKCPIHTKKEMVCLSCRMTQVGMLGGKVRSKAKTRSGRKNIKKANIAKREQQ